MAQDTFYRGTDWSRTNGPIMSRAFHLADLWPVGPGSETGGGDKEALVDGIHPAVAIGPAAQRPLNLVGVVMTYNEDSGIAQLNIAEGFAFKAHVANVLTYDTGAANTFETSLEIGQPVYIDDSDDLDAGVNLSLSPFNDADEKNPLVGIIWYDQDEYLDAGIGGPNTSMVYPKDVDNALTNVLCTILRVNALGL